MTTVALVVHGHDPAPAAGWTARNVLCIDTGVHWPERAHLTVAEIQTGHAELHRFAQVAEDALLEAPPRPASLWDHGHGINREAFIAAMGTAEQPSATKTNSARNAQEKEQWNTQTRAPWGWT